MSRCPRLICGLMEDEGWKFKKEGSRVVAEFFLVCFVLE
jgi:hypothetical protein